MGIKGYGSDRYEQPVLMLPLQVTHLPPIYLWLIDSRSAPIPVRDGSESGRGIQPFFLLPEEGAPSQSLRATRRRRRWILTRLQSWTVLTRSSFRPLLSALTCSYVTA
jgi:hypothetical protein